MISPTGAARGNRRPRTVDGRGRPRIRTRRGILPHSAKQSVRQGKLVQFSRFESCPAKVSRPAGIDVVVSGGNK